MAKFTASITFNAEDMASALAVAATAEKAVGEFTGESCSYVSIYEFTGEDQD